MKYQICQCSWKNKLLRFRSTIKMISLTKHLNVWCIKNAYFIFLIRNEDKAVENLQTCQILDSRHSGFQLPTRDFYENLLQKTWNNWHLSPQFIFSPKISEITVTSVWKPNLQYAFLEREQTIWVIYHSVRTPSVQLM